MPSTVGIRTQDAPRYTRAELTRASLEMPRSIHANGREQAKGDGIMCCPFARPSAWRRITSEIVAEIRIPDTKLAREATDLLREHGTALLLAHSLRV